MLKKKQESKRASRGMSEKMGAISQCLGSGVGPAPKMTVNAHTETQHTHTHTYTRIRTQPGKETKQRCSPEL